MHLHNTIYVSLLITIILATVTVAVQFTAPTAGQVWDVSTGPFTVTWTYNASDPTNTQGLGLTDSDISFGWTLSNAVTITDGYFVIAPANYPDGPHYGLWFQANYVGGPGAGASDQFSIRNRPSGAAATSSSSISASPAAASSSPSPTPSPQTSSQSAAPSSSSPPSSTTSSPASSSSPTLSPSSGTSPSISSSSTTQSSEGTTLTTIPSSSSSTSTTAPPTKQSGGSAFTTSSSSSSSSSDAGSSDSDSVGRESNRIALGVGIGLGLPTLFVGIVAAVAACHRL